MRKMKILEKIMKSGSQKTEFQGEFGARHEKHRFYFYFLFVFLSTVSQDHHFPVK